MIKLTHIGYDDLPKRQNVIRLSLDCDSSDIECRKQLIKRYSSSPMDKVMLCETKLTLPHSSFEFMHGLDKQSYQEHWQQAIQSRYEEAQKRFPDFLPCFLLEDSPDGLQYSIHLEPLTPKAQRLAEQFPTFPSCSSMRPIEMLWRENGTSELDLVFERFPSQLKLETDNNKHGPHRNLTRIFQNAVGVGTLILATAIGMVNLVWLTEGLEETGEDIELIDWD